MTSLMTTLVLASEGAEGLPASHIASKLAVPLGILIFCGSVYALLWANYGAKKGALVYGTAFGGFCFMLGIFWWFGAPGTPVATGLRNFPGQPADQYASAIYPFEPGSETATHFEATNEGLEEFVTVAEFLGKGDMSEEELNADPRYTSLDGEAAQAEALMIELALRTDDAGTSQLGGDRRAEYQEAGQQALQEEVGDAASEFARAEPFFTGTASDRLMTMSNGTFLMGTEVTMATNWVGPEGEIVTTPVDEVTMFAFKEPAALWFPSAVWTAISFVLFAGCLFGLDRIEQREKRRAQEVQEPEDLAVSIRQ